MGEKHVIIPIFLPHKGCPHDCIFCNQRKISGQICEMNAEKMRCIIESHFNTINEGADIEIAFYGGSFTGIEKEKQIAFLETANQYVLNGKASGIRLSTRPDYINKTILEYLKIYNVRIIELGVQSMDDKVLASSHRGHTAGDVVKASKLIKSYGFKLGIQTMIGLPGDTKNKDMETADKIVCLTPDLVRIYPVLVIKGTYLETLMRNGEYIPQSVEEAVQICSELLELYQKHDIKVIRIGLQPSDSINKDSEVAAGPFHPAFRQLVESRLALKKIEEYITSMSLQSISAVTILTGKDNISNVTGQNRSNVLSIKTKYGINTIKIKADTKYEREIVVLPY